MEKFKYLTDEEFAALSIGDQNSYIESILKILKPDNPIVTDLEKKISKKLGIKETLKYIKSFELFENKEPLEIKKMQLAIIKKYPEAHKIRMSHQRDFWKVVLDEKKETEWKPSEDEAWEEAYNKFLK